MLTIKEICDKTGLSLHTFQFWRRNDSRLLPEPVAVAKRVIYFDDSIVERIKFIRDQQTTGKSLEEIEKLLDENQQKEDQASYMKEMYRDDGSELMDGLAAVRKKWEGSDCKNDVCLALKLDPALSGHPTVYINQVFDACYDRPLLVYVSIFSNGHVHFAVLKAWHTGEVELDQREKIMTVDYAMLLYIVGQAFAKQNMIVETNVIPLLLFCDLDLYGLHGKINLDTLKEAREMNKIFLAGQEFVRKL